MNPMPYACIWTCVTNPQQGVYDCSMGTAPTEFFLLMALPPRLYFSLPKGGVNEGLIPWGSKRDYMTKHLLNILTNKLVVI